MLQINQKQFPVNFFKKDPKTGIQRRFTCLVCNVSLFDENLVRTHCFSQVSNTEDLTELEEESLDLDKLHWH